MRNRIEEAPARVSPPPAGAEGEASVEVADLGGRIRVTVEFDATGDDAPSRRRALAKAWEALAAAISETKAALPPVPAPPRSARKRGKGRGARTGSGSWWQF